MQNMNVKIVVYFGSHAFPITDSLVISNNTNVIVHRYNSPTGDMNNDNNDDFLAYITSWGRMWLGSSNLTDEWDLVLGIVGTSCFGGYTTSLPAIYGDLNNDGFSDVISTDSEYGGDSGIAYIWMGRSAMNGTVDLVINCPSNSLYRNFGWSKAAGDFNADGFCDIAISSPWWNTHDHTMTPGKVYVYSGNAELHDTTVANEDENVPSTQLWKLQLAPNPVKYGSTYIGINFLGDGYKTIKKPLVTIYNLKGQRLISKTIPAKDIRNGSYQLKLKTLKTGIYILSISDSGKRLASRLLTIK